MHATAKHVVHTMLVTYAINRRYQRDFNREWAESLRAEGEEYQPPWAVVDRPPQ